MAAAAVGMMAITCAPAQAASQTGWVNAVPPNSDGISFLDTSTIINAPALRAESRIYTTTGTGVPCGYMGVRPRLFKSGVLCQAIDYKYNSHGFVSVFDADAGYKEYITFPTNPLNYTAPATARAVTPADSTVKSGTNSKGQTFGTGDVKGAASTPDLVQAYATNGAVGYVKASDLAGPTAATPAEAVALTQKQATRTITVYASNGTAVVGQFTIR